MTTAVGPERHDVVDPAELKRLTKLARHYRGLSRERRLWEQIFYGNEHAVSSADHKEHVRKEREVKNGH